MVPPVLSLHGNYYLLYFQHEQEEIMIYLKFDVCAALTAAGYGPKRCQDSGLIGNMTYYKLKKGIVPGMITLNNICQVLELQPGSIIGWKPDQREDGPDLEALPDA